MTKHMFAGASTPKGFINFFDHILPLKAANKRIFLKGSSGSGKSTFIKKAAAEFESLGEAVERIHCANDIESLDALTVPGRGLAVIDATAPHSCDPEIPAAVDTIIDFAQFIDGHKVRPYMEEIHSLLLRKKALNEKAAFYLAAAGEIYRGENIARRDQVNKYELKKAFGEWFRLLDNCGGAGSCGTDRKLFLSAVTPDGFVSFAEDYFSGCKVYALHGGSGLNMSLCLAELRDEASERRIKTLSCYCPFAPEQLEYLYLPETGAVFALSGGRYGYKGEVHEKINVSGCFDTKLSESIKESTLKSGEGELFDATLKAAVDTMNASRQLHAEVEEIYAAAIDFEEVDKMTGKVVEELLR